MVDRSSINPDAKALENAFFARENAKILEQMRAKTEHTQRREALRAATGDVEDATLDRLLELGVSAETVLALTLVPLVRVAWADGDLDAREREAIARAAAERGLTEGTPGHRMLTSWLTTAPDSAMVEAWQQYMRGIWPSLGEPERAELRDYVLGLARGVAQAAGGFLGLGSKVSSAEAAVLKEIEAALQ
jgi:hypothetical protein